MLKTQYLIVFIMLLTLVSEEATGKQTYHSQLNALTAELANSLESRAVERVAFLPFQAVDSREQSLAQRLQDDFMTSFLNQSASIKVYERERLDQVLEELKLQQSGLISEASSEELGKLIGVEVLLAVRFDIDSKSLHTWAKAIETETAFQIAATSGIIKLSGHESKRLHQQQKSKIKFGSLEVKNRKNTQVVFIIENEYYSHELKADGKSEVKFLNLPPGIYSLKSSYVKNRKPIENVQIEIRPKKTTKHKLSGFGNWGFPVY